MNYNRPYTKKVTVASTAVALDFNDVGFQPVYVKVINVTKKRTLEHVDGMAALSGFLVKEGASDIFSPALVTSNAITLHERGFKLGVETSINVATDVLYVIAY
jgi:hypothetical protein